LLNGSLLFDSKTARIVDWSTVTLETGKITGFFMSVAMSGSASIKFVSISLDLATPPSRIKAPIRLT
jgi:copper(I)-binding protein